MGPRSRDGGVRIATLQLAVAPGSTVAVMISTEVKAGGTRRDACGEISLEAGELGPRGSRLTPGEPGGYIVGVRGNNQTIARSRAVVRVEGIVLVFGRVEETAELVSLFTALMHTSKDCVRDLRRRPSVVPRVGPLH